MELGDRTPSQLLREIQNLAGTDLPDHIIHGLWLKKLNGVTQQILAVASNTPLTQQAERADKVTSVHVPHCISAVTPSPEIDTSDQIAALAAQVKTLTTAVDELMRSRGSQHSRHMSPGYQQQSCCKPASLLISSSPSTLTTYFIPLRIIVINLFVICSWCF
uniref:Uncharacterized protein n=1 Tax=Cacopsylla melanoneura TaxID=428564 RepID=A0A8D9F7V9_9HEMI